MAKMPDTPVYTAAQTHRPSARPKSTPFQQAFREARAAGKKAFEFPPGSGRRFSAQTAEEQGREIGAKAAAGSGRGASAGRTAADRDMVSERPGPKTPAGPRRDTAAEARGAETLERMKSLPGTRSNEEMRDEAKGRTLGALGAAATLAGGPLARMAMGRAAAKATPVARREPEVGLPSQGRVFRSARPDAEAAKQAEYMRRVEELGLKKGGTTKAYAKGGSVRGAGCETRSKKSRYI